MFKADKRFIAVNLSPEERRVDVQTVKLVDPKK